VNFTLAKLALVAACLATPAIAQDHANDAETRIVSTDGLDLSKPKDVHTLDHRLSHAIADVCGDGSAADSERARRTLECRRAVQTQVTSDRSRAINAARHAPDRLLAARIP